jgi:uncharacterized membrane protein
VIVTFQEVVEGVGKTADGLGVAITILGVLAALVGFGWRTVRPARPPIDAHRERRNVGQSILLGLELLVAGDIIRTVAIAPTFTSVGGTRRHRHRPHLLVLHARSRAHVSMAVAEGLVDRIRPNLTRSALGGPPRPELGRGRRSAPIGVDVDHDFDVVGLLGQGVLPSFEGDAARDESV